MMFLFQRGLEDLAPVDGIRIVHFELPNGNIAIKSQVIKIHVK